MGNSQVPSFSHNGGGLLFHMISMLFEKTSLIITTDSGFSEWGPASDSHAKPSLEMVCADARCTATGGSRPKADFDMCINLIARFRVYSKILGYCHLFRVASFCGGNFSLPT